MYKRQSLQLYSSAKIQKLGDKSPLEVKIETPENITKVTQDMYRNAAVTLGVEHAKITVAAPIPVTGESALAGIYYSLEANGAKVPQANKAVSYTHLTTTNLLKKACISTLKLLQMHQIYLLSFITFQGV